MECTDPTAGSAVRVEVPVEEMRGTAMARRVRASVRDKRRSFTMRRQACTMLAQAVVLLVA